MIASVKHSLKFQFLAILRWATENSENYIAEDFYIFFHCESGTREITKTLSLIHLIFIVCNDSPNAGLQVVILPS